MKLIFAVDAIFPPLTGIGRYAWELAQHLATAPEIRDVRFFAMGRWVDCLDGLLPAPAMAGLESDSIEGRRNIALYLRKALANQVWAVHAYSALAQRWFGHRLRPYRDHLYHSPNFFVPPFDGISIATVHDLSIYKYPETHPKARRKLFELEMARTLRRVSHIITGSEATRKELIDFFSWPASRITAIHHGVAPVFRPRTEDELVPVLSRYQLSPGTYSLCVSTIEPRKKIGPLLSAYEAMSPELQLRYPLVLVGAAGWLNSDIHEQMQRGMKGGWVRYLGFVPESDLPFLYAGARGFCYPSIYEGFGLPVLEAMASGVPVLTSDQSSLPEVSGGAGWLVDPDDHDALCEGICRLLTDDIWRDRAIQQGRKIALDRTWDACVSQTVATYKISLTQGN